VIIDSLVVCKFSRGTYFKEWEDMAKLYSVVTGYEMTPEELKVAGERINNIGRIFNIREGLGRKDDTLPYMVSTTRSQMKGLPKEQSSLKQNWICSSTISPSFQVATVQNSRCCSSWATSSGARSASDNNHSSKSR
jgi:aldehyde:ferredoxin oxidoreductase